MKHLVLAVLLTTGSVMPAMAQPTWRFHIAFEDGTGARDTLWLVYDTSVVQTQSHWPVDISEYEQSRVGLDYSDGEFHVFTINDLIDSTNSIAFPYSWFPIFETGGSIDAINWTPPMTLRWDTSLFRAPYLPYVQGNFGIAIMDCLAFFAISNHPELGAYDMLINNDVTVDQFSEFLFPFGVYFGPSDGVFVSERSVGQMRITPNPAHDRTSIKGEPTVRYDLHLIDVHGGAVLRTVFTGSTDLELGALSAGIYLCRIAGSDGSMAQERLVIGR